NSAGTQVGSTAFGNNVTSSSYEMSRVVGVVPANAVTAELSPNLNSPGTETTGYIDGCLFATIGAGTIIAEALAAGSVTASKLAASLVYAGSIVIDSSGHIRSGADSYDDDGGWFIGRDGGEPAISLRAGDG